jgi:hypothetical protein
MVALPDSHSNEMDCNDNNIDEYLELLSNNDGISSIGKLINDATRGYCLIVISNDVNGFFTPLRLNESE